RSPGGGLPSPARRVVPPQPGLTATPSPTTFPSAEVENRLMVEGARGGSPGGLSRGAGGSFGLRSVPVPVGSWGPRLGRRARSRLVNTLGPRSTAGGCPSLAGAGRPRTGFRPPFPSYARLDRNRPSFLRLRAAAVCDQSLGRGGPQPENNHDGGVG